MSKMKKIILGMILTLVGILGISTVANAYYVGQGINISYNEYASNGNIYCVEHKQALRQDNSYNIISHVNIEGNKSTDHTGKTIESRDNAKLAYILCASNGDGKKDDGQVANSIWNFMYTWMSNVGQHHAGLYHGFANNEHGNATDLDQESSNYADSIQNMNIQDNTNKANLGVVAYSNNGKDLLRVGPFNWSFNGKMTGVEVQDQNGKAIGGLQFSSFNGNSEYFYGVDGIQSGRDFYISVPMDLNLTKITKVIGNAKLNIKAANIWFLDAVTGSRQNLIIREPYEATKDVSTPFDYNISVRGSLKVIKVNKDNHTVKLKGVGFYIQHKNTGKYVKQDEKGMISYVSKKEEATEFITDNNGEILVKNLVVGTYVAYETKNPNYGYEIISDGKEKTITIDKTTDFVIENKQIYVKLSGYVWLDKIYGKQSLRNDLYKDGDYDSNDLLLDNITVRLKDKTTGKVVKEAKTADGGAYLFMDVLIEKLQNYYIEFEYDGLTYTNVIPHIEKDNGSKSAENATVRDEFNKNFSVVEGRTQNTGYTRDANGNEKHNLSYNVDQNEHTSTLINNGQYTIVANTDEGNYSIRGHFTYGQEEVKYINLGLYEREQPDIALIKDLENVRLTINGYEHTYQYAQRFLNAGEYGDGFNVGVKFGNKYGSLSYSRAVYKSDYEFINEADKSKELKVYVTYQLAMKNQSTNLITQINSLVDYYDSNYKIVAAGTGLDQKGNITGNVSYTENTYNNDYSKAIIQSNTKIEAQKQQSVYVQFELNKEAVLKVLNDGENLENVAEINFYSIFDQKGKVYAGIDKDSNPGNAVPGNKATYEDDTDSSPALKLEVADARELSGKVFFDATTGELKTGEIRQGSGAYEEGEKGIEGVTVNFKENTGSGKTYTATTNENGDFNISNYIPGDYTAIYTWGDQNYKVQNYKGTVYDNTRDRNNKKWYKEKVDARLTDALDDYNTRLAIDNEIKRLTNSTQTTIHKMDSATPTMGMGIEYENTYTASTGDRYVYEIKNVDFGIVERARQDLGLDKRISKMKVTLANGQIITDITIDEKGNITGEKNHVTYMKPSQTASPKNGFLKLELDNELIQGATVEVGYTFTATNNSELDYLSEEYYHYGIIKGDAITIEPTAIIDYLDNGWAFDSDKNSQWTVKSIEDLKNLVAEVVYKDENSTINGKTILYTESLKGQKLQPKEKATVDLLVSKVLTTKEEISLNNETEVIELNRPGGRETISTPGNYVPGTGKTETDDSTAETFIVTPSTGDNQNFILPIAIGVTALIILGAGVIIIKRKTLSK